MIYNLRLNCRANIRIVGKLYYERGECENEKSNPKNKRHG
jgi:hypothetical protein